MEITIRSIHFNSKSVLNNFINEQLNNLVHLFDRVESAEVILKLEKTYTREIKICDIHLSLPGNNLYVSRQSDTFEAAAHEAVDGLLEQINRIKVRGT